MKQMSHVRQQGAKSAQHQGGPHRRGSSQPQVPWTQCSPSNILGCGYSFWVTFRSSWYSDTSAYHNRYGAGTGTKYPTLQGLPPQPPRQLVLLRQHINTNYFIWSEKKHQAVKFPFSTQNKTFYLAALTNPPHTTVHTHKGKEGGS